MLNCFTLKRDKITYYISSSENDRQAKGWDHDPCREEYGQLFAGITGGVCVVNHSPGNAIRDRREDIEEEKEQGPVCAAEK